MKKKIYTNEELADKYLKVFSKKNISGSSYNTDLHILQSCIISQNEINLISYYEEHGNFNGLDFDPLIDGWVKKNLELILSLNGDLRSIGNILRIENEENDKLSRSLNVPLVFEEVESSKDPSTDWIYFFDRGINIVGRHI
tara:strand:- start:1173 stop:1595 length:423 start_codon:yes stop_codon:yes gene_type:complete